MPTAENLLRKQFVRQLVGLKSQCRADIRERYTREKNSRVRSGALNHVRLTDNGFNPLLLDIATTDVFTAARILRERNSFTRGGGTQGERI